MEEKKETMLSPVFGIFLFGLLIRFLLVPYTGHVATWEQIGGFAPLTIWGFNPLFWVPTQGVSFWPFYLFVHSTYFVSSLFGFHSYLMLQSLGKIPTIIGDVMIFYCLYKICMILSGNNKNRSLIVASAYFLNPYTIWMSSMVGHPEQLSMSFVTLAFLFLLRRRIALAAFFACFAGFFQYLGLFLFPAFTVYVYKDRLTRHHLRRFTGTYLASFSVLLIPYVALLLQLYQSLGSETFDYFALWLGGTTTGPYTGEYLWRFDRNFTGFLAQLDIWPSVGNLFGFRTFLLLYAIVSAILIMRVRNNSISLPHFLNRQALVTFVLFILTSPLSQHHYLLWVIPFLVLETHFFHGLPRYYLHMLWAIWMIPELFFNGSIVFYYQLRSFGSLYDTYPLRNWDLTTVTSVLSGFALVLVIVGCLRHAKGGGNIQEEQMKASLHEISHSIKSAPTSPFLRFARWRVYVRIFQPVTIFVMYSLFTFFSATYSRFQLGDFVPIFAVSFGGLCILVVLRRYVVSNYNHIIRSSTLFASNICRFMAGVYFLGVFLVVVATIFLMFGLAVFLIIQLWVLLFLWRTNKKFKVGLGFQRCSLVFTLMFVTYALLRTRSPLISFAAVLFFPSWLYLMMQDLKTSSAIDFMSSARKGSRSNFVTVLVQNSKISANHIAVLVFVFLLLIGYQPVILGFLDGSISNQPRQWHDSQSYKGTYVNSGGNASFTSEFVPLVGPTDEVVLTARNGGTSWASYGFTSYSLAVWNEFTREHFLHASVKIYGYPTSENTIVLPETVTWQKNNFTSEDFYGNPPPPWLNMSFEDGLIVFTGNLSDTDLPIYERTLYMSPISTEEGAVVVSRFKTSGPIGRLQVYTSQFEGIGGFTSIDTEGEWKTFVTTVDRYKAIYHISIGIDAREKNVNGMQTVSWESVMILRGEPRWKYNNNVRLVFNNQTIFNQTLTYLSPEIEGYTFTPSENLNEREKYCVFPIDTNLLKVKNSLNITVEGSTVFNMSRVLLVFAESTDETNPGIWTLYTPHICALWVVEVVTIVMVFRRFSKSLDREDIQSDDDGKRENARVF